MANKNEIIEKNGKVYRVIEVIETSDKIVEIQNTIDGLVKQEQNELTEINRVYASKKNYLKNKIDKLKGINK